MRMGWLISAQLRTANSPSRLPRRGSNQKIVRFAVSTLRPENAVGDASGGAATGSVVVNQTRTDTTVRLTLKTSGRRRGSYRSTPPASGHFRHKGTR